MFTADDPRSSPLKLFSFVVTLDPVDTAGLIGGDAVFTAAFIYNVPAAFVTVQWNCSFDGVIYEPLVETAGVYEGVATTTLTVKNIDNFLATRSNLRFRLAIAVGPLTGVTGSAALTVARHTTWDPSAIAAGSADTVTACACTPGGSVIPPAAVGFSGPFTYNWVKVDGAAITCDDPTLQSPSFTMAAQPAGIYFARYKCEISNGLITVPSDPFYVFAYFAAAPAGAAVQLTVPDVTTNGGVMAASNGAGNWALAAVDAIRGATVTVLVDNPSGGATGFSLSSPFFLDGGQALVGHPYKPVTDGFLVKTFALGAAQFFPT